MIKKYLLLLLALSIQACQLPTTGLALENDEIDKAILDEIYGLNESINHAYTIGDEEFINSVWLKMIKDNPQFNKDAVALKSFFDSDYTLKHWNDYYSILSRKGNRLIYFPADSLWTIYVNYRTEYDTTFASFLVTEQDDYGYMFSYVYAKSLGQWKVQNCSISPFSIIGMDSNQLFYAADSLLNMGYELPAILYLEYAAQCSQPSQVLSYSIEDKLSEFTNKVTEQFIKKNTFPIAIPDLKLNYGIYKCTSFVSDEQINPHIYYVTNFSLIDVELIEDEMHKLVPIVEKLFPGITKISEKIIFFAFEDPPIDPSIEYSRYGRVIDLNTD